MNYAQALRFLYSQLPMYQRVGGSAFKKGLGNTRRLLKSLGDPHQEFPCIHIAGTNGKGTVAHMIASCLTAAGYKTGLYVSPHYKDFRERMKVDGKLVPKKDVVAMVEQMREEIGNVKPSFFEMTVAMAFRIFADQEVDIAIIETGLGGRLDSTNVITPELSIVTNVSFDHMSMLGNTLPKIAREKAGIIKTHVPVVIGEYQVGVAHVFRSIAARKKAPISYANRRLQATLIKDSWESQSYNIKSTGGALRYTNLVISCSGPFQSRNLVTTLHVLDTLVRCRPDFLIEERHIRKGLGDMQLFSGYQGRWQVLGKSPLVLCDSGHNVGGLEITMERIAKWPSKKHFVIGFVNDKELDDMLSLFPRDAQYYFCRPDIPRGLDALELHAIAELYGLMGKHYHSVRKALSAARQSAGKQDLIFIGGSTFVVAEVL